MNVGDFVVPLSERRPLACGSGLYARAVVVSMEPFVLVSEWGDMRWSCTIKPQDVRSIGPAPKGVQKTAMHRFYFDFPERKPPSLWRRIRKFLSGSVNR